MLLVWWVLLTAAPLGAQTFLITEFSAVNKSVLRDEDGEFNDWIEIYNAGEESASIGGWYLSNDPLALTQWEFPQVTVPGQGFLVVFASGKDRTDPAGELHASFKLNREGEYLGLIRPDGVTVASQFSPQYPRQLSDVSYGVLMEIERNLYVAADASARWWLPDDALLGLSWTLPGFDHGSWNLGSLGIGYDREDLSTNNPSNPNIPDLDVTTPGDPTVATSSNSPGNEGVLNAIDDNPATKYLNFDTLNAGLTVTPVVGESVVTRLRFTSANDAPDRDPTTFVLSGSDDGLNFTLIAQGSIPDFTGRFFTVEVDFNNDLSYGHYRLLFPTVRDAGAAVAMQIAEIEFIGRVGPALPNLADLIGTDLESGMLGQRTSAYVRIPFMVESADPLDALALQVRYDDGFVAYLNGTEVARANAPVTSSYDAAATVDRPRLDALVWERFSLIEYASLIQPGENVLAVQALNDRADSPEFLFQAELDNVRVALGEDGYFDLPTPGGTNTSLSLGLVDDPVPDHPHGLYEADFLVVLTNTTEGVTMRYTTNGSAPTEMTGYVYEGPIPIGRTTVLRAAAFRENWRPSRVVTMTYLFLDDIITQNQATTLAAGFPASWNGQEADYGFDPRVIGPLGQDNYGGKYADEIRQSLRSLPSMSIVMDIDDLFGSQGIYSNPESRGASWERAASLELIYPDQSGGFQQNAGIRVQGGAFRRFDLSLKKSFRLIFSEEYGATKLKYPLFGPDAVEEFDNFILRANSNDAWRWGGASALYIRDAFADATLRDMGGVAPHSGFVHLYINGLYWGLYNPVERPDATFSASYVGGEKETWDAINQDSAPDGNFDAWNRLLALLGQDVSTTAVYQQIQGNNPDGTRNPAYEDLLDVDNMVDYMILNFYVGNSDWPHRNYWVGRDRNDGDGFKFYPWDTETAMGLGSGLNTDRTGVNTAVARPYAALRANADFRIRFADRVYRHFFNGGALQVNPLAPAWDPLNPDNNRPAQRLSALAGIIDSAVVAESGRWGDQLNTTPYTRDEHWRAERDDLLGNYFPQRSANVLQQFRNAGLYPGLDPPVFNQQGGSVAIGFTLTMTATGGTIYYTTDGTDPLAPVVVEEVSRYNLLDSASPRKVLVPSVANGGSLLGASWRTVDGVNDGSWLSGSGGVGYDTATTYTEFIGINVDAPMRGVNGSAFIRIPFNMDGADLAPLNYMFLRLRYDDGFAAYLNGQRIASASAPADPQWNSFATAGTDDALAVQFREFDVSNLVEFLQPGTNLLAIQGLNVSLGSSDFLIDAELVAGERRILGEPPEAMEYTDPIVLQDLTSIKARVFDGLEWSALNEVTFVAGTPRLVVTELNYHPYDPTEDEFLAGFINDDDFEFIEFYNAGTATFDLNGVHFTDGVEFDFTGSAITRLPVGQYVLVVKNRKAFEMRYGTGWPVAGEHMGGFSNGGERIALADGAGNSILEFTYGTLPPWPVVADGYGPSLVIRDLADPVDSVDNWQASANAGGSPGVSSAAIPVLISEISREGDTLRLVFEAQAGHTYMVYCRDAFNSGLWEACQSLGQSVSGGLTEVRLSIITGASQQFFRIGAIQSDP